MKNFIAQSIISLNQAETGNSCVFKASDSIIDFVKGSKDLSTKFNAACTQTVHSKNQHCQNFYFQLLEYETVHATRGKDKEIEIEKLILQQIKHG